ncbi:MAG: hypothetical protein KA715_09810 [Xanthomonadaceae bacterium]|nr:hypothetical protein [Xanthomonadaceae bacterium]
MTVVAVAVGKSNKLKSWEEVRRYQNPELLFAFERKLMISSSEASELFYDLKHYLWLSAFRINEYEAGHAPTSLLRIDQDLWLVDEAWHLFLQFSKDYQSFCEENFGFFLHHAPVTERERENNRIAHARNPELFESEKRAEYKEMLSWIYDHAGPETVKRWFLEGTFRQEENLSLSNNPNNQIAK